MKNKISILLILLTILAQQQFYGQNTGPVAPEAVSFEPVDATDMVNLLTGDFSYVLPLLEVPGPEGGYPIALSYHGGIAMDQEASWVGLGWNINPGAISRSVNNYPDDFNKQLYYSILHNEGNTYTSNFVNVLIPLKMISIGLSYSWGSSRAFGGSIGIAGAYASANIGGNNSSASVGIGIPFSPTTPKEKGLSIGMSVSKEAIGINIGPISINSNGEIGLQLGSSIIDKINYGMDLSLSSNGLSGGVYIGKSFFGISAGLSSNSNYSSETTGWQVPLILLNFGHSKTRYWKTDSENRFSTGSLYLYNSPADVDDIWRYDGIQNDNYSTDVSIVPFSIDNYNELTKSESKANLMIPSYDNYSVNAQGLGGIMSPKIFNTGLIYGNTKILEYFNDNQTDHWYDDIKEEIYYHHRAGKLNNLNNEYETYFYMNNTNTGNLMVENGAFEYDPMPIPPPDYDPSNPIWGDYYFTGGNKRYSINSDQITKRKGDGTYITYFTNKELFGDSLEISKTKGFIETNSIMFDINYQNNPRENQKMFPSDGIGAFTITKPDGITYHYSLPVYQFEEITHHQKTGESSFFENQNIGSYAYTWLLTGITGPDFVDNEPYGIGVEDYGYWVSFVYGKWTDGYYWQQPYEKSNDTEFYSYGRKQIYYLNEIKTRTHTAYFIKSIRMDGLGQTISEDLQDVTVCNEEVDVTHIPEDVWIYGCYDEFNAKGYISSCTNNIKHEVLKLDEIILVENTNEMDQNAEITPSRNLGNYINQNILRTNWWACDHTMAGTLEMCGTQELINFKGYYFENILESDDFDPDIYSKAIKVIEFSYDYKLCENTPNTTNSNGKLTLNELKIKGQSSAFILPSYKFYYNIQGENSFDLDQKDIWGFDKSHPENWSLKEIQTPIGGNIKIEYEPDTYNSEVALNETCYYVSADNVEFTQNTYDVDVTFHIPNYYNTTLFNNLEEYAIEGKFKCTYNALFNEGEVIEELPQTHTNFEYNSINNTISFTFPYDYAYELVNDEGVSEVYRMIEEIPELAIKIYEDEIIGGGVRVKSISVENDFINENKTLYDYSLPYSNLTSGSTSYAPFEGTRFVPYINFLPGPGVMYKYVTINTLGKSEQQSSSTIYEFETLEPNSSTEKYGLNLGNLLVISNSQSNFSKDNPLVTTHIVDNNYRTVYARSTVVKNNLSALGRILDITKINQKGDIISKTTNSYKLYSQINSGISQETFYSLKNYKKWFFSNHTGPTFNDYFFNSTSLIDYPNILDSTVTITDGIKTTTSFSDYDLNTGIALSVKTKTPDGKIYKASSVPAYSIDKYKGTDLGDETNAGMGSKVMNPYNKNMLTQQAANITYLVEEEVNGDDIVDIEVGVLSANAQSWKSDWGYRDWAGGVYDDIDYNIDDDTQYEPVWRKHQTFAWKGEIQENGLYHSDFANKYANGSLGMINNWDDITSEQDGWKKTSEITRYNHYSAPIEVMDINENFASTSYDVNDEMVQSSIANANYRSFGFTGFETYKNQDNEMIDFGGEFLAIYNVVNTDNDNNYSVSNNINVFETYNYGGNIINPHTGSNFICLNKSNSYPIFGPVKSMNATPGGNSGLQYGRTYQASVWMNSHGNSELVLQLANAGAVIETVTKTINEADFKAGDWWLVNATIDVPDNTSESYILTCWAQTPTGSSTYGFIDDLRVHPIDAPMTSYVYDQWGNPTFILDNDNIATQYEYDDAGRLKFVYKETPQGFVKVKEYEMHYAYSLADVDFSYNYEYNQYLDYDPIYPKRMIIRFTAGLNETGADYLWDFGDGTSSTEAEPVHEFISDGPTTVTLKYTNPDGEVGIQKKNVHIYPHIGDGILELSGSDECSQSFHCKLYENPHPVSYEFIWNFQNEGSTLWGKSFTDPNNTVQIRFFAEEPYEISIVCTVKDPRTSARVSFATSLNYSAPATCDPESE